MEQKELNETLFTKAFETQHNAFLWVALTQRLASTVARSKLSVSLPMGRSK
ncbi:hypothetical protein LEP1GSC074_0246 [Leptospira noguchii str. Hook]|nr:hypothetical protein LEP1GSC074_0246 [Leptospira noguchii str. Hook]